MLKTEKATRQNVMKALSAATDLDAGDVFVLYYSGRFEKYLAEAAVRPPRIQRNATVEPACAAG